MINYCEHGEFRNIVVLLLFSVTLNIIQLCGGQGGGPLIHTVVYVGGRGADHSSIQ